MKYESPFLQLLAQDIPEEQAKAIAETYTSWTRRAAPEGSEAGTDTPAPEGEE